MRTKNNHFWHLEKAERIAPLEKTVSKNMSQPQISNIDYVANGLISINLVAKNAIFPIARVDTRL